MPGAATLDGLTVVVPVGPGDAPTPALCAQLAALPSAVVVRVVHAEGDEHAHDIAAITASAAASGPRWDLVRAARGRASQLNAGTRGSDGPWLWFLHADCVPTAATLPALARFIARGEPALGYFDLRFLDDGPALMRLNALGVWLRSHCLRLPFGDQGLVLPRAVFEKLGGFDTDLARGEDHDLVWRARRAGVPLRPVGAPLLTSARRYAEHGWAPTTAAHLRESWRQARRFSRAAAAAAPR